MERVLNVRIVRWQFKVLYVIGVWLVGVPVLGLLGAINAPALVGTLANAAITLAGVLLGARIFRGGTEPVGPRRPWWQMTARPLLSRVLGIILAVVCASYLILGATAALGVEGSVQSVERLTIAEVVASGVVVAVLAFLYLNSAARLGKMPPAVQVPQFQQRLKLN